MLSFSKYKQLNESFFGLGAMNLGFGRNGFAEAPVMGGQPGMPPAPGDPTAGAIDPITGLPIDPNDPNADPAAAGDPTDPGADPAAGDPAAALPKPGGDTGGDDSGVSPPEGDDTDLGDGGKLGSENDPDAPTDADAGDDAPKIGPDGKPLPPDPNDPNVKVDPNPMATPPMPGAPQMCGKCKSSMKGESKKAKKNLKTENLSAEDQAWWKSVNGMMGASLNPKYSDGINKVTEDKLITPANNDANDKEPGPGQPGFAPQARIGTIGSFAEWAKKKGKLLKG